MGEAMLDGKIDQARASVEHRAVMLFRLRMVPPTPRLYRPDHAKQAQRHYQACLQGQARLRVLWAERCRRDGIPYENCGGK